MKSKLNLDKDSIQRFFLHHVEKIVFGAVAAISLFLVYSAVTREGFDKSPKDLSASVDNAQASIGKTDPNPNDLAAPNVVEIAQHNRTSVDEQWYAHNTYLNQPLSMGDGKRGTPAYLPISEIQARDGRGPLARKRGRPTGERWILVWGVVPLSKQAAEYRKAFENAKKQDPKTDSPIYLRPVIERAEVAYPGEEPKKDGWEELDLAKAKAKLDTFASPPAEMIDASLRPKDLAFPLPPRADQRPWGDSIYPELLVGPPYRAVKEDPGQFKGKRVVWMAVLERLEGKCVIYKRRSDRATSKEYDYFAVEFADNDTAEQNTNLALVTAVVEGSMTITVKDQHQHQVKKTVPLLKIEEPKRAAAGDAPDNPPPRGGASEVAASGPDSVLFRFIDFEVEPGKSYVYRVSLELKNPNFDYESRYLMKPDDARRESVRTASIAMASKNAVSVPIDIRLLAEAAKVSNRLDSDPSGKMMIVSWVQSNGIEAFDEFPVIRGLVADFPDCRFPKGTNSDAAAGQPAAGVEPIQVDYLTGATVLDIRGGDKLPGNRERKTTAPAEYLVLTAQGKLEVAGELDDVAEVDYRLHPSEDPHANVRPKAQTPRDADGGLEGFK